MTLPSNALAVRKVLSYRSNPTPKQGEAGVVRVAVAMELENPGTEPWTAREAVLVGRGQEVKPVLVLWQPAPLLPGAEAQVLVVVELELPAQEARGTFTLKLWDESGKRLVTLENVTFP